MSFSSYVEQLRSEGQAKFPSNANTAEFARELDSQDPIRHLRDEFILPTKASLKKKALDGTLPDGSKLNGINGHANGTSAASSTDDANVSSTGIYFCGNSLGPQPKALRRYLNAQLETWGSIGVGGHFQNLETSPLACWQDLAEDCAIKSAAIVGAKPEEVVIMNTLTANLHLLMASFYRPTEKRHKIILEWRPFPSDYGRINKNDIRPVWEGTNKSNKYAIESQIQWHNLDPSKSMITIQPDANFYISTDLILRTIDEHADETALILLPGIQYYSGQLFDIERITAHAQSKGIVVGWDLAHAAGNVELRLHDWNVDFAAWCTYKYQNAGPGSIAGAFVHERHGAVERGEYPEGKATYRPRLSGWYGGDKSVRFNMDNKFLPTAGAGGYQVSNPSAIDLASLLAALSVFEKTDMATLRSKSLVLTAYAELLLDGIIADSLSGGDGEEQALRVITPRDPSERGTQLSVLLRDGLLDKVSASLTEEGILCDKRKPGVIRVAPVPMYCTFDDVWRFMNALRKALA
ncbi:Kynureninase 1 [Daldinia childiae]|uniref:Kynureninase 1 n=1 Tax=Daldinia childiae TaxID=326645 RepID=UPI001444B4E6|nr:Kynureninase 1 [Daldinia childiae]KAF3062073.1 Kynureninase 1 [Daldinia childiae]